MIAVPKQVHPQLGSAAQCARCDEYLDDDDRDDLCKDCQLEERKAYAREYGEVDERDYRAGRGMPRG